MCHRARATRHTCGWLASTDSGSTAAPSRACQLPFSRRWWNASHPSADPKQLAEFWDGLSEAERRSVMAVKEEHNGERTLREVCAVLCGLHAVLVVMAVKEEHSGERTLHEVRAVVCTL